MPSTQEFESKFYQEAITQCLFIDPNKKRCNKTLGFDSRSLDYGTCPDHRRCSKCSMLLGPLEISSCVSTDNSDPTILECLRCRVASQVEASTGQSIKDQNLSIDLANASRLAFNPDLSISIEANQSNMRTQVNTIGPQITHEHMLYIVKNCEAVAAYGLLFLKQNPNYRKEELEMNKREKQRFKEKEEFIKEHNKPVAEKIREKAEAREAAKKQRKDEDDLSLFMLPGISREQAIALRDQAREIAKNVRKNMLK